MTYSIVARDGRTGQLGVAVQSHYFSVGPVVPWAEAGVGAVATQAFANRSFGPDGLAKLRAGASAAEALRALLDGDSGRESRQVALVDAQGRAAVHTGNRCIAEAGSLVGDGFSVQANMMERATVWPAMARAFEATAGPLAERLLAALDAAEREGGDIRGRQSAALLVVEGAARGDPALDRPFDLRVEDHPDPLGELRRLVGLRQVYAQSAARLDWPDPERAIARMRELAPGNAEIAFWAAIAWANRGEHERARELLAQCGDARWRELARRLVPVGMLSAEAAGKLGL